MNLKKALIIVGLVIIPFLDFAALDDITTGNEPGFTTEYAILAVSIPLILVGVYYIRSS